jgi:hypothetical protein
MFVKPFKMDESKGEHYPFFNLRAGLLGEKMKRPLKKADIYEILS